MVERRLLVAAREIALALREVNTKHSACVRYRRGEPSYGALSVDGDGVV